MKILACTHEPFWPLTGGGTSGTLAVVRELQALGHELRVAAPLHRTEEETLRETGVPVLAFNPFYMHRAASLRFLRYALYAALYPLMLLIEFRTWRPDVIYCKNTILSLPIRIYATLHGIPSFLVATDLLSLYFLQDDKVPPLAAQILGKVEGFLLSLQQRSFVISPEMARAARKISGLELGNLYVNGDGIDLKRFDATADWSEARRQVRDELGFSQTVPLAVYHGTIEPHHGGKELLEIIQHALRTDPELHVLIIAAGPGYNDLRKTLASPRVRCLDFMPHEKLVRYLAAGDCGLLPYPSTPSTDILYPYKFLEYYALGLPVVAFPLEALEGAFRTAPLTAFAHDTADFAAAVIRLARSGQKRGRDPQFEARYAWSAVVKPIDDFIRLVTA